MKRKLLILSCSMRKIHTDDPVAALDLYDGVAFRVVKRMQRCGEFPDSVNIFIVSAKYGLIPADQKITFYDQKMTLEIACQQAKRNCLILRQILSDQQCCEIFANLGTVYLKAIQPINSWLTYPTPIILPGGRIGQKLQRMKRWLQECHLV